jgi:hypothetical protein
MNGGELNGAKHARLRFYFSDCESIGGGEGGGIPRLRRRGGGEREIRPRVVRVRGILGAVLKNIYNIGRRSAVQVVSLK